jgi:hypothetical protein
MSNRLKREQETLKAMIALYCQKVHGGPPLCESCNEIQTYALQRLEKCAFGEKKPTCGACRIHCYKPNMREQIRIIMRFSGPWMLLRHPWLALQHARDGWRKNS